MFATRRVVFAAAIDPKHTGNYYSHADYKRG